MIQNMNVLKLKTEDLKYLFRCYVLTPVGIILYLMVLYGIQRIINCIGIRFPSSVCLMLIQFAVLSALALVTSEKQVDKLLYVLEVPCGFSLRWMNVYFIPAFVVLPLSPHVDVAEAFTILGIYVIGYLAMFAFLAYSTRGLEYVQDYLKLLVVKKQVADEEKKLPVDVKTDDRSDDSVEAYEPDEIHAEQEEEVELMRQLSQIDQAEEPQVSICQLIDWIGYLVVFMSGIVVYFCTGYEMVYQLGVTVLLFKCCLLVPAKWKKFVHPILVSFAIELLVILMFTQIRGEGFLKSLRHYKTGRNYNHLFNGNVYPRLPGCGDLLSSLMDVSIVSLSVPMYRYRRDLVRNYLVVIVPILLTSGICFFCYPPIVSRLGVSHSRSLGFTGRSVTLALGTPLVTNLGGDLNLMSCCTVISGILGVITGDFMFKIIRVKTDMVQGMTLGLGCGAVSTSHLLTVNPRAASVSSLGFTLFGTVMVVLSSIDPCVRVIKDSMA